MQSALNVHLYDVVPNEVYWPAVVEARGENFDSNCLCQVSLQSDVFRLTTEFVSQSFLTCDLNDFRIEKALLK